MPNEETNHKDNAASNKEKEKKHDSGAADLEKVTDYAEEKEIGSSSAAEDAIAVISMIFQELKIPTKCLPLTFLLGKLFVKPKISVNSLISEPILFQFFLVDRYKKIALDTG